MKRARVPRSAARRWHRTTTRAPSSVIDSNSDLILPNVCAASRVQMQRHYLSDVAFGAALGIVAGRAVTIQTGGYAFALSPVAAPGPGVNFTLIGKR